MNRQFYLTLSFPMHLIRTIKVPILFFIAIISSCSGSSELKQFELKGQVKSAFQRMYETEKKFGKWEKGSILPYSFRVNFNKDGFYQEVVYYDGKNLLQNKAIPTRIDSKLISETFYDKDGEIERVAKIKKSGNPMEVEAFDKEGDKLYSAVFFRKNGVNSKIIQTNFIDNVESEIDTIIIENKNGIIVSEQIRGSSNSMIRYEILEFDANGNWTKKISYRDNEDDPINIIERTIEYYE